MRRIRWFLLFIIMLAVLLVSGAFADNGTLVLPADLEEVGPQAFYGLKDVTTVIVPDWVEEIGDGAFGGSTSLQVVEISPDLFENPEDPDEIAALEARILTDSPNAHIVVRADAGDFEWEPENGHAVVTGYTGEGKSVRIPAKLGGLPVTVIGENSFSHNNLLEEILIPEGVTTIEKEAFQYSWKLKAVHLPDTLTEIGSNAFWQCGYSGGESFAIVLPDHITTIGSSAFDTNFNSCTKPDTHSTYGIPVCNPGTDTAAALMNAGLEFSVGEDLCLRYGRETTTSGVQGAFVRSFGGDKTLLKALELPEGVIGVCNNVFSGCTALVDITFPSTLIKLGSNSFAECGNDSTGKIYLAIPASLTEIDDSYNSTFFRCNNIMFECAVDTPVLQRGYEFVVAGNHDCILRYTYFWNPADQTGYEGLLHLVDYCGTNPAVVVPDGVQVIEEKAFSDSQYHGHENTENTIVTSITFPDSLIAFDDYAFYNCRALTSVTIPQQVTWIPYNAFRGCSKLSSIVFHEGVTTLDYNAFYECGKDVEGPFYYILPDNISKDTSGDAFNNCNAVLVATPGSATAEWLAKMNYAFTVAKKYDYRFRYKDVSVNGTNVSKLFLTGYSGGAVADIPGGIYAIDSGVFRNNTMLTTVIIPEGTAEIGQDAFNGCSNLTKVTLPETLTKIDQGAFRSSGTAAAETYYIHMPDSLPDIIANGTGSCPFKDCPAVIECNRDSTTARMMSASRDYDITFPDEHDFRYRYVSETENGQTVYRLYLYKYLGDAAEVRIPAVYGVSSPSATGDKGAFAGNTSLTKVIIPEGTVIIQDSAFSGCTHLTDVTFPSTLKTLKNHAFERCGIASSDRFYYVLPGGVSEITVTSAAWDSFNNCKAVLVAPAGSSACLKLDETYLHYHSLEDARAHANIDLPASYKEGDENSYKGNW